MSRVRALRQRMIISRARNCMREILEGERRPMEQLEHERVREIAPSGATAG